MPISTEAPRATDALGPTDRNAFGCVTIFIPTYKNEHLLLGCVRSCLSQTYTNIRVVVADNGFSECQGSLGRELEQFKDPRLVYHPNTSNIGCQGNFSLILSLAQTTSRFIIIPADVLLASECVEKMVAAAEKTPSANMVYPRSISRDVRHQALTSEKHADDRMLPWPHKSGGPVSSAELIRLFYSASNLDSDWSHFSYIGSLIDGALLRSVAMPRFHLWDHGNEKLISLTLLSYADDVVILDEPLLIHYTNAERLGTARRVGLNYTRYEPLYAQYHYLEAYEPHLVRRGVSLSGLYVFLLWKTLYTMVRYPGHVYLLLPKALGTLLRVVFCILPVEAALYVFKKPHA